MSTHKQDTPFFWEHIGMVDQPIFFLLIGQFFLGFL
jgi:hypothetical protein